ncbi:MAG TPA: transglycosylase SLT domain-containing protein [Drouetiella sp.]
MRHHQNFQPERFDGEASSFQNQRPHFGPQQELGRMSFSQAAQFHHAQMTQVFNQMHHNLPRVELYGFSGNQESYMMPHHRRYGEQYPPMMCPEYPQPERQHHRPYDYGAYVPRYEHVPHHHRPHHPRGAHYGQYQPDYGNPGAPNGYGDQNMPYGYGDQGMSNGYGDQGISNGYGGMDNMNPRNPRSSIYTYDGAVRSNPQQAMESARVVAEVAKRMGVDPVMAVAAMLVESGGNPRAVGDNGHSFGLFQLNYKGELAAAHLSPSQAFNAQTNAEVALSYFRKGHVSNPGAVAAAAQRPANRADYARKVNSNLAEAEQMVRAMGLA